MLTVRLVENLSPRASSNLPPKPVAHEDVQSIEAPWLDNSTEWSIRRSEASSLRPGVFCFAPSRQAFLRVVAVTHLRGHDDLIFIDLSDGRSLKLSPSDEVFIRATGDPH
jgi:hypothetical protein